MSFHQERKLVIAADLAAKFVRHARRSAVMMAIRDGGLILRLHAELLERSIRNFFD
ncbi:hypothetical protein BRAS3843_1640051 [Bradyrhizobium sp. STM 3843]|nr:hypothetical protein BRAS3843_1640051 [Bradyrhizobium sp. STM 3843]